MLNRYLKYLTNCSLLDWSFIYLVWIISLYNFNVNTVFFYSLKFNFRCFVCINNGQLFSCPFIPRLEISYLNLIFVIKCYEWESRSFRYSFMWNAADIGSNRNSIAASIGGTKHWHQRQRSMKEVFEKLGEKIRSWISLCVSWRLILNKSSCNKIA